MASSTSDVLAVEFLQHAAGNRRPQRVVPLFETAGDPIKFAFELVSDAPEAVAAHGEIQIRSTLRWDGAALVSRMISESGADSVPATASEGNATRALTWRSAFF